MKKWSYYDVNGNVIGNVFDDEDHAMSNCPDGCKVIEGEYGYETHFIFDGVVNEYSPEQCELKSKRPGVNFYFDNHTMQWIGEYNSLEKYQNVVNADIEFKGEVFQADKKSYDAMISAYQGAVLFESNIEWKLKNNKFITLTVEDLRVLINMIHKRNQQAFKDK